MPIITLVRHGQASFGAQNYDQLSQKGYAQARRLAHYFDSLPRQVDMVVTGAMQRHKQTADTFWQNFSAQDTPEAVEVADLNEFDHEQVLLVGNGLSSKAELATRLASHSSPKTELYTLFNQAVMHWQSGQHDADYNESWAEFQARAWQGFLQAVDHCKRAKLEQKQNCMVFTSGGVISAIVGKLLELSDRKIFELNFTMANAAMTQVKVKDERFQLMSLNEYSYLYDDEQSLLTWH